MKKRYIKYQGEIFEVISDIKRYKIIIILISEDVRKKISIGWEIRENECRTNNIDKMYIGKYVWRLVYGEFEEVKIKEELYQIF